MAPALPGVLSRLPSFRNAMDAPGKASPSKAASSSSPAAASPHALPSNSSSSSSASTSKSIRWRKGELIGAGAFGRVYMGMNLDSGELLAVKQVLIAANNVAKEKAQAHVRELEEEVKLLQNLSHPNIVRYLGTAREDEALNIFLEFVPGGSIASLLGKFGSFPEPVIRMYARQLLEGLQYLHKNGIMHRDIKGANILVDNKGCIKLADFGASKQVVELVTLSGAKSMKGTPYWMAPEVIRQTGHSLPADIWSVGCTIIEMATGKPPWSQQFQEVAALFHIGTTKSHPPIPEHLSNNAKDFLLKCLKKEPHLRPTATELLQHPFVNPLEHPMAVRVSTQIVNAIKASQAFDHSKKQQLANPLQESNSIIRRSLALFQRSTSLFKDNNDKKENQPFEPDLNCSVILDCDSFTSFKSTCEPPKFYEPGWNKADFIQVAGSACLKQKAEPNSFNPMAEPSSFNPMAEPNSFNPMAEPDSFNPMSESTTNIFNPMSESTTNIFNPMTEPTSYNPMSDSTCMNNNWFAFTKGKTEDGPASRPDQPAPDDSEFSFQCGSGYDDEEVTETKIKAFIDEKALELKRLQTPLYMEYHSIQNPSPDTNNGRNCPAPLSPTPGRQLVATNSRSQSKASTHSGLSIACSRDTGASASSGSPSANNRSVNFSPAVESPRLSEWKGLLLETQQPVPSPKSLSSSDQHRVWKEELQKELEMRREEKRMLSRLASSSKSSPASKTASPKGTPRQAVLKAS